MEKNNNTDDRRIRKTKKALHTALADLLQKKDLRDISIRELTDAADIHRGTFYSHYQDIYDLYEEIESDFFEEISTYMVFDPTHSYIDTFQSTIDFVEKNAAFYRVMYSNQSGGLFRMKLRDFYESKFIEICLEDEEGMTIDTMPERWKYIIRYQVDGILSLLSLWIESNFSMSKEDLLELMIDVDKKLDTVY